MRILADLHVHSAASIDGVSSICALAAAAKARGLDAIAVSDHNLCTAAPKEADVLLIPAVEISTDSGHLLGLFLKEAVDPAYLSGEAPLGACVEEIHRCGGAAVLAHPYAPQKLSEQALLTLSVDAIEAVNARAALHHGCNEKAARLAQAMGLSKTGGSDAHSDKEIANAATAFEAGACTLDALREALFKGSCQPVLNAPCRWRDKGVSKLQKARREGETGAIIRAHAYRLACALRDWFHI